MNSTQSGCSPTPLTDAGRRGWLMRCGCAGSAVVLGGLGFGSVTARTASLTQEQRDSLTPDRIIEAMKKGNERFRSGKMKEQNYLAQKRSSATGQYPAAIILGCIDSRVPAEIVLDAGIGDTFIARVAGNVANSDMLGSMEFACAASGAKVVLVMGHTACGAIKGAIDNVQLGNLTGLFDAIKPAIQATDYQGERSSKNPEYVDAVGRSNVRLAVNNIRSNSSILADLEKKGQIKIVGSMYELQTGMVNFLG